MNYKEEVIDPGDEISRLAREVGFDSHGNCPAITIVPHDPGNFRGPIGWLWSKKILKRMADYDYKPHGGSRWTLMEEMENDGAGGKPQFFTLVGTPEVFYDLGWEIIAMTADDFARTGRFPCIMANELQVKKATAANMPLVRAMFSGFGEALEKTNLVNITGETAIMKRSITAFCDTGHDSQLVLTWGATCIGLADRELLFNSADIKPGMVIVGFHEKGYRCNGGGVFTELLLQNYGDAADIFKNPEAMDFVKKLTIPSISYAKTICRIIGWQENGDVGKPLAKVVAAAHITGGGLGKLKEILPEGVGAVLNQMPVLPEVLREAQEMSFKYPENIIRDKDVYTTFHGGCGMVLIAATRDDATRIITEASRDSLTASVIGFTDASNRLQVISQGMLSPGRKLIISAK